VQGHGSILIPLLILAGVSFLVYAPSLSNGFVFDDNPQIVANPWIKSFKHLGDVFSTNVTGVSKVYTTNYYRPLMYASYALIYQLVGLHPFLYHLLNVLVHCGVTLMVFFITRRLLPFVRSAESSSTYTSGPFIAALLFAAHPIHTEAVMWVSALPDLATTLFSLASLLLYIRASEQDKPPLYLALSLASYAVALLFKEPAVTLPVILVVYDLTCRKSGSILPWGRYIAFLAVTLAYLMARTFILGVGMAPSSRYASLTAWETAINIIPLFPGYLRMLLLPLNLNAFYTFHPVASALDPRVVISLIVTAAFLVGVLFAYKRNRVIFFCLAFLVAPLLPALYLPALGENPAAERYLYLPSVGFVLMVGLLLTGWCSRLIPRSALMAIVALVLGLYCLGTVSRATAWKDDYSLWADTATKSPDSATVRRNLGYGLYTQNRLPEAIEQYRLSLGLNNHDFETHHNLGVAYALQGMLDQAIEEYRAALAIEPRMTEAMVNMGLSLSQKGRASEALASCQAALRENPYLASGYYCAGIVYGNAGHLDQAIVNFKRASELDPEDPRYSEYLDKAQTMKSVTSGN
jgi:protein O-mannosyl-transferase